MVVQEADLPDGFVAFDRGPQIRSDAPPGDRADPTRFGRVGGWKARYRRLAASRGIVVVESRADLFADEDGADEDLDAHAQQLAAEADEVSGRSLAGPEIGDEAAASTFEQGPVRYFTVAWRRANVEASLVAVGPDGTFALRDVVRLARKQDRRIAAAATDG